MTLDTFAIYNLIDGEKEPSNLIEKCHSQCPRDDYLYFRKAPEITSIRSLIDFHLHTTVLDGFDPNLFLVVTNLDWQRKGLMIVTIDNDEGKPDKFTMKAANSGILLISPQIGNNRLWRSCTSAGPELRSYNQRAGRADIKNEVKVNFKEKVMLQEEVNSGAGSTSMTEKDTSPYIINLAVIMSPVLVPTQVTLDQEQ
ncbi:hypothetical protein M436DRAFT_68212 [Aureobasidium namibiae CBS 147.97]|uniref:Uncharacterized protein n=1 Tax=Aureobasidium namibiae CBS 147.97 TaxID=1043004 RepID=A0A074X118_9PEZI|nr:uncharacterized protein M436DRAFT_68212 [Aureobasidium namibiae CBS 147.97]KEQ68346.1 hypothetical protein M436DRAFT_68212 [Aureobasidium namibiae CBS 147.97]